MNNLLLIVISCPIIGLLLTGPAEAQKNPYGKSQVPPPAPPAARVAVTQGPELESARFGLVIITWTSNNPGGSDEHWGVVHYGTNPRDLSQVARSHIRLNQNHSETVFRVRVTGLQPQTTYYYTVDSAQANGKSDGIKSPVKHFTTPADFQHVPAFAGGREGQ